MLTPSLKFWLDWHTSHSPAPEALRARIILLTESATPEAIAESLGVPFVDVTTTRQHFAAHQLGDFPHPAFTPLELLDLVRADVAHARRVADSALTMFDAAPNLHHLPASLRPVLETTALLHNLGASVDEPNRHLAARELLQHPNLTGITDNQQALIADVIGLHRKKVDPEAIGYLADLSPVRQRQTLALAALLRVADGLDDSQTQTTELHGLVLTPEGATLRLSGPHTKADGARARKRADLWRKVFHLPLETAPAPEPPPDLEYLAALELTPDTLMSDVTRRALALHLLRWQAHETAALEGDPQAIKALRVSVRRWRQALLVFGAHFKYKPIKRLRQRMRQTERVLGELRDWETLLTAVRAYQASLPQAENAPLNQELQALITVWDKQRAAAVVGVKKWLSGPQTTDLLTALTQFIGTPPIQRGADETLKTSAPQLLREAVAAVAPAQAALTNDKPRSYHELRLTYKHLRYALEFLAPALPSEAPEIVEDLVKMQDRLGALSDNYVLQKRLDDYLDLWAEKQAKRKAPQLHGAHALLDYLRVSRESWTAQVHDLAVDWPPVRAARLKQRVNALLKKI